MAYGDWTDENTGGQFRSGDVDIEAARDAGEGFNVGWMMAGEWLKYTLDVTLAGDYIVAARVASNGPGGSLHLEVDGVDATGAVSVPDTGGWQQWTDVLHPATLSAGVHVLRVVLDSDGPSGAVGNLNYLRFTPVGLQPYGGVPIPIPGRIEAEQFDEGGRGVAYADATDWNSGGAFRNSDVDIEPTTDARRRLQRGLDERGRVADVYGRYQRGRSVHAHREGRVERERRPVPRRSRWRRCGWSAVHSQHRRAGRTGSTAR